MQVSSIYPENRRIKMNDAHLDNEEKKTQFSIIEFPMSREIELENKEMNVIKAQGGLKREPFSIQQINPLWPDCQSEKPISQFWWMFSADLI